MNSPFSHWMPIPHNKNELITAITSAWKKLRTDLIDIPSELTIQKELEGHAKATQMSVRDLVSYLIGWGELVLKWHQHKERNEPVDFPETGYKWNELGQLAQKFYKDYEHESYAQLMDHFDTVAGEILTLIDSQTDAQLYGTPWYEKWTLGRMIQLNTSSPYKNARARIRKWKKLKGL